MTKADQVVFISAFLESMSHKLLGSVYRIPDDWDGMELRQWVSDAFSYECYPMDRARKRAYENEVIVRNL